MLIVSVCLTLALLLLEMILRTIGRMKKPKTDPSQPTNYKIIFMYLQNIQIILIKSPLLSYFKIQWYVLHQLV